MSSPAPATLPSSPWLAPPFLLTSVLVLVGFGTTWGVLTTRQDAADRARVEDRAQLQACNAGVTTLQVRVATAESEQASTRRLLDTEIAGLRRDMERIANAMQRLSDASSSRAQR